MTTLMNKQTSVISTNMSQVTTFTANHDSCLTLTFRDVFVLYKVYLINDVTLVDKTLSTTYSNSSNIVNLAKNDSDTPCSRPGLLVRLM